jgi:RNase adaptor protein for sRNA GlmZ degradation
MRIVVGSFSYRVGYPVDTSSHGGGFVFDCRFIKNPGREEQYKQKTGKDSDVQRYIAALPEADRFFASVIEIVMSALASYEARGFDYLSVQFGCTGGQHRSVYFAELLAQTLKEQQRGSIELTHRDCPSFS